MAGRIGNTVRLGTRVAYADSTWYYEDGGAGNVREALALDWASDDGEPLELELSIATRFMDRALAGCTRPGSMLPFRWGTVQSIGGVTIDEGGSYAPMAPITARGVRVQLVATALRVDVGFLPFPRYAPSPHPGLPAYDPTLAGWVDLVCTIAPIQGGGSSLLNHTMQLPMIADRWPGGVLPEFFELPRFSREWRMHLSWCATPDDVLFEVINPALEVVSVVTLDELSEWSVLDADAWGFRPYFSGSTTIGVYDGTLTVSFR